LEIVVFAFVFNLFLFSKPMQLEISALASNSYCCGRWGPWGQKGWKPPC